MVQGAGEQAYFSWMTPRDHYCPETTSTGRLDILINIILMDDVHIDVSPYLQNTRVIVYSWAEIWTQARQLRGECAYIEAIPPQWYREYYQMQKKNNQERLFFQVLHKHN